MINISKTFERVYVINLDRRRDRMEGFFERCPADWPFAHPVRFSAIDGTKVHAPDWWKGGNGAWGCFRSHLAILERCLQRGFRSVLILEDDAICGPEFARRAGNYIRMLPKDWGMAYFGGQHLMSDAKGGAPQRVNDEVYQPFNVNRTHAYALRGGMIQKIYRHLTRADWMPGHHIDHHLGRFHQRREGGIYCPRTWLIGQADGVSNISHRKHVKRFWAGSDTQAIDPKTVPFVALIGLHSSGSSCLAGVLHHLGIHLGNQFSGYYGKDPNSKQCGFEAVDLAKICEDAVPFPATSYAAKQGRTFDRLRWWVNQRRREAIKRGTLAGGKYPQMCRLGDALKHVCGKQLRIIHIERPVEESIASMVRRCPNLPAEQIRAHQEWLVGGKQQILQENPDHLTIEFGELLADPRAEIVRIVKYLGIEPTPEQVERAAAFVDPGMRHVTRTEEEVSCG